MRGDERDFTHPGDRRQTARRLVVGKIPNLELKDTAPLHITGVTTDKDGVAIKLANATPFTRVHVAATRFLPGKGTSPGSADSSASAWPAARRPGNPNLFSAGRQIGDEYRYILERRYGKLFPATCSRARA